jgi:WD40 repeat protein
MLSPVLDVQLSPDDRWALTLNADGVVHEWDMRGPGESQVLYGHERPLRSATFSHDPAGKWALTGGDDGTVRLWDVQSGRVDRVFDLNALVGPINSASFSADDSLIVVAGSNGPPQVLRREDGSRVSELRGHIGAVTMAEFSPVDPLVVTAGQDGTARVWDAATGAAVGGRLLHCAPDEFCQVNAARFSPDGRRVLTLQNSGPARLWDFRSNQPAAVLSGTSAQGQPPQAVVVAEFSPAGQPRILTATGNEVRLWDADTGQPLPRVGPIFHTGPINVARFSADGTLIVTGGDEVDADGRSYAVLRVWDATRGGEPLSTLVLQPGDETRRELHIIDAAFAPGTAAATGTADRRSILIVADDNSVRLWRWWRTPADQRPTTLASFGPGGDRSDVARFSADGRRIVAKGPSGVAYVRDVELSPAIEQARRLLARGGVPEWTCRQVRERLGANAAAWCGP